MLARFALPVLTLALASTAFAANSVAVRMPVGKSVDLMSLSDLKDEVIRLRKDNLNLSMHTLDCGTDGSSSHTDTNCGWTVVSDNVISTETNGPCPVNGSGPIAYSQTHEVTQQDSCTGQIQTSTYTVPTAYCR